MTETLTRPVVKETHRLIVDKVTAGYGPVPIVEGASISTESGRLVALIGPNGAGKSTLLKAIMGILKPTSGSVILDDRHLEGKLPEQMVRAGLGYVPQVGDVFDHLTVSENLMIGGISNKAMRNQKRDELLELFPLLASRMRQRARTLSGGERRVLAIARALMSSPAAVMMDEPSAGLSPRAMATVWNHLALLREQGLALLVVEQKAKAIMEISDWVYVLVDGKNAVEASGGEMLQNIHDLGRIFMGQQIKLTKDSGI
ncbi:MAG TPA: ABC transporter ATP-binding protein [Acidimicrobiales bacterium]